MVFKHTVNILIFLKNRENNSILFELQLNSIPAMNFDLVGPIGEGVNFLKTNFHIWYFSSAQQSVTQNESAGSISSELL